MNELNLALDDLKAAETPDSLTNLLIFTAIGAGIVAVVMAFRK